MIAAVAPPSICSREMPLHSVAKPGGRFAAKRSIAASASPEPWPGLGPPLISIER